MTPPQGRHTRTIALPDNARKPSREKRESFPKYCWHVCEITPNKVPLSGVFPPLTVEEAEVKKARTYREYKAECIRIAQSMSAKDRETLLKMAEAWEDRAREAERQEKKTEAGE